MKRLTHKCWIAEDQKVAGQPSDGSPTSSMMLLANVWCRVTQQSASKVDQISQGLSLDVKEFEIKADVDLPGASKPLDPAGFYIVFNDKLYHIHSVEDIRERGWWKRITAHSDAKETLLIDTSPGAGNTVDRSWDA